MDDSESMLTIVQQLSCSDHSSESAKYEKVSLNMTNYHRLSLSIIEYDEVMTH